MGSALYFDINDHFLGKTSRIINIDLYRYCYIDLLDNVTNGLLSQLPTDRGVVISLYIDIPGTTE